MLKVRPSFARVLFAAVVPCAVLVSLSGCSRDPNVRKQKYLESGKKYEANKKYKEAVIQFSNALKVDSGFADAHFELGETYLAMGSMMAGYTELLRAVDLAPSNVAARVQLGNLLLSGGAPDRALAQAKAIQAINPNNADAYAIMAGVSARAGDKGAALDQMQHALTIDPNRAAFHTQMAYLRGSVSNTAPEAEAELRKAIALDPKEVRAHLTLAAVLAQRGDSGGAEQQYLAAIQAAPDVLQPRLALVELYLRGGDKAKAEQTLRKATEELPESEQTAGLLQAYYQQTGQPERAESVYADLVGAHPKNIALQVVYAKILLGKHEDAKAQGIANELNKKEGSRPDVQLLDASLQLNAGKTSEAFDTLQRAVKDAPQNWELQMALAKVAGMKGDEKTAETSYQAAQQARPNNTLAVTGLAEIAAARRDYNQLMEIAERTVKEHPEYADGYVWRGTAEANTQQIEKAEADFQTALKLNPNNISANVELGQLRLKQGKTAEGTAMLEKALDKDPNAVLALNLLISPALAANDTGKAVKRLQDQIGKAPKNVVYLDELAGLQMATRDFAGARDSAAKALQLNPSDEMAVQNSANAYTALGDKDKGIGVWEQWIVTHARDDRAMAAAGQLEENKGDQAKAIEYYKKALEANPAQVVSANNLAYLMLQGGQNLDEALTLAQTARRGAPNSPNTADTLAWVYYAKGRYASARDLLEDAAKLAPKDPSIHYHLGMAYSKLGDKAAATLNLKKAAELDPNSKAGKDAGDALAHLS